MCAVALRSVLPDDGALADCPGDRRLSPIVFRRPGDRAFFRLEGSARRRGTPASPAKAFPRSMQRKLRDFET